VAICVITILVYPDTHIAVILNFIYGDSRTVVVGAWIACIGHVNANSTEAGCCDDVVDRESRNAGSQDRPQNRDDNRRQSQNTLHALPLASVVVAQRIRGPAVAVMFSGDAVDPDLPSNSGPPPRTQALHHRSNDREDGSIDFDVVTELVFPDRAAYLAWAAAVQTGEPGERVATDEQQFLDQSRTRAYVVEEYVTSGDNQSA